MLLLPPLRRAVHDTACVPFQWFNWFYSDWFSIFRLSLTIYLSFERHKFLHWWIKNSIPSTIHQEIMWQLFLIHILWGVICFLLPHDFSLDFLCTEFNSLLVGEQANEKIWLKVRLKKVLGLNSTFLDWHRHDHSDFNHSSVLKNLSVWWQTTVGHMNSGQLEYHILSSLWHQHSV